MLSTSYISYHDVERIRRCIDNVSNMNHDVVQGLALQVRHGGIVGGVSDGKQHQELLIGWALKDNSQPRSTVEWCGCHRHETHVLKKGFGP